MAGHPPVAGVAVRREAGRFLSQDSPGSTPDLVPGAVDLEEVLAGRLREAAAYLLDEVPEVNHLDSRGGAMLLLDAVVAGVREDPAPDRLWLATTALCGSFPTRAELDHVRDELERSQPATAAAAMLRATFLVAYEGGLVRAPMEVVEHRVLVDASRVVHDDEPSGIHRLMSGVLPLWLRDHDVLPVAWSPAHRALRRLSVTETAWDQPWNRRRPVPELEAIAEVRPPELARVVVPWRSIIVELDVPTAGASESLAAMGRDSGSSVVAVAYDLPPDDILELLPAEDSVRLAQHRSSVTFASRVGAVSRSATSELAGVVTDRAGPEARGPVVGEVPIGLLRLPVDAPARPAPATMTEPPPTVLVVGHHEPRKNHFGVLDAAEASWAEGVPFSLSFVGGGWDRLFAERVTELQADGRPLTLRGVVSDMALADAYRTAAFTVFPSLHALLGLPVAESIAAGTPVITADRGITGQLGSGGGALLVDPDDPVALLDAMRTLLTDRTALNDLREAARRRTTREWPEFAADLWDWLVQPETARLAPDAAS